MDEEIVLIFKLTYLYVGDNFLIFLSCQIIHDFTSEILALQPRMKKIKIKRQIIA